MGASAFILAVLKSLPAAIALFKALIQRAENKRQQGIGYDQAVKEALEEGAENLRRGDAAEEQARKDHATKAGDEAFDNEFARKD